MDKRYKLHTRTISLLALSALSFSACSEWTEPEALQVVHNGGYNTMDNEESEAYYADLRAWKQQAVNYGRPVSFCWYSNWSPSGAQRSGYLSSLPDSIDIVSMWNGFGTGTPEELKDRELVQKKKGTKLLAVSLLSHLGKGLTPAEVTNKVDEETKGLGLSDSEINERKKRARWAYWGFTSGEFGTPDHYEAIKKFAKALCDDLVEKDIDGYDIDWEPGAGFADDDYTLSGDPSYIGTLIKEMGKYIGPMSDPEGKGHKLFCIDGEVTNGIPEDCAQYFDYIILQTYGTSRPDFKIDNVFRHYGEENVKSMQIIVTENFEAYATTGGYILDLASYKPKQGPLGGVGAYRLNLEYGSMPDYRYFRQAIQLMHKTYAEYLNPPAEDPANAEGNSDNN